MERQNKNEKQNKKQKCKQIREVGQKSILESQFRNSVQVKNLKYKRIKK